MSLGLSGSKFTANALNINGFILPEDLSICGNNILTPDGITVKNTSFMLKIQMFINPLTFVLAIQMI